MADAPDRPNVQKKSTELTDLPEEALGESVDAKVTGGSNTRPIIKMIDPCWRPGDGVNIPTPRQGP